MPREFAKCDGQVSLARESAEIGNLRDAHVRFGEQAPGAFDPPTEQIAVRRHSDCCVERAEEMTAAVPGGRRKLLKREFPIEAAFNEFLDARQLSSG